MGMDANGMMQQRRKRISGNMILSSSSVNDGCCSILNMALDIGEAFDLSTYKYL